MSNGIPVTLTRAIEELLKYRHGLKTVSGGITLSGGEPLMQDRFAVKLFTAAKTLGIHTALDTNEALDLEQIDLVPLDIKAWGPEHHRVVTGVENGSVLEFARRLGQLKKPVWVRFVLVPGMTDNPAEITRRMPSSQPVWETISLQSNRMNCAYT